MSVFAGKTFDAKIVVVVSNESPTFLTEVGLAELEDILTINPTDFALDELCQIHSRLLYLVSKSFHNGANAYGGYITLMCDKIMAEIKNQLLYMAI